MDSKTKRLMIEKVRAKAVARWEAMSEEDRLAHNARVGAGVKAAWAKKSKRERSEITKRSAATRKAMKHGK